MPTEAPRRSTQSRINCLRRHALNDPREATAAARAAFADRWERQVDPDYQLAPDERARRAERLKRAHFLELALRSAQVRGATKKTKGAAAADAVTRSRPTTGPSGDASHADDSQ